MLAKDKLQMRIFLAEETRSNISSGRPVMNSAVEDMKYLENTARGLKERGGLPKWWPNPEKW